MGTRTRGTFRTELQFLLKNRTDAGVTTARLNEWIDQAYLHVGQPEVHRHEQLKASHDVTLVTAQNTYDISNGGAAGPAFQILVVRSVVHLAAAVPTATTRRQKLRHRGIDWFDEVTLTSGPPFDYTIENNEFLTISGVPTATENGQILRLRVFREPARLTTDASVTVLPDYWDEVVLKGAQWKAERDLGYRQLAEETKQDFALLINELRDREVLASEEDPETVSVRSEQAMEIR